MKTEEATIGARVRALKHFAGIPVGTEGMIDEDYGAGVTVAWDLPERPLPKDWRFDPEDPRCGAAAPGKPLRDGFNKETEFDLLEVVCREEVGRDSDGPGEPPVGEPCYRLAGGNIGLSPEMTAFIRFVDFPEGSGLPRCPVCGKKGEEPPEDCDACENCYGCPAECGCDPDVTTCANCGGSRFWTMPLPFTAGRMATMRMVMSEPLAPLTPVCTDHPLAPAESVHCELMRSMDYLLYLYGRDENARRRVLEVLVGGEPRGRILTLEEEGDEA